jgi:phosphoribosyl 1,2-cyclic phosphodiesterase
MSVSFEVLGSSSKGNCYLLRTPESNILVDAGFSGKTTALMLERRNLTIGDIHAVFITHEHNDHCSGIRGLRRSSNITFFANKKTAAEISDRLGKAINWSVFENEKEFRFRDLEVTAFPLPHDAADPIGYVFSLLTRGGGAPYEKICVMADLGYVPHGLAQYASDVDWLVLEANHDLRLLELDLKRPEHIKDRIRGRYGHLSNDAALSFVLQNFSKRWKKITFVHLSCDCNTPEIVRGMIQKCEFPEELEFEIIDPLGSLENMPRRAKCD